MKEARWKGNLAGGAIIALIIAVLSIAFFYRNEKTISATPVAGVLEGMREQQSRSGTGSMFYVVGLPSGEVVTVSAPSNDIFRNGARVIVVRHETNQGRVTYTFDRYDRYKAYMDSSSAHASSVSRGSG